MNGVKNISLNKKNNSLAKFFAGAIVLFLILFVFNFFNVKIKNYFYSFSAPVQKTLWTAGAGASGFLNSILKAGSLAKENEDLKTENQKLLAQITSLGALANANQAQADIAPICQANGFTTQMAGVIGLDGKDMLTIDKGADNGIAEGMPVVSQQNALFGKVFKVYKNFSQVMLISNKDSIIDVSVNGVYGVAKGLGDSNLYLDLVPIDQQISQGDAITTSSLEKVFPKDILVGTVSQVQKNDQKPFQQAKIQPFFDLKKADNLFVITNYKR